MKAVLCAALYPNAAVMDEAAGRSARPAWNDGTADVHIHPSSINHPLEAHQFLRPYLVYLEKVSSPVTSSVDCCFCETLDRSQGGVCPWHLWKLS